ncbi:hypothetical protein HAX54_012058 [Datura stramonium]|uniref:Uncharacterized protein n=1 Tax=Datura stramonium TaxID=4076 RepID=A0ABS8TKW9_DATST|nr:hypothetical protein [Datura stramonium]
MEGGLRATCETQVEICEAQVRNNSQAESCARMGSPALGTAKHRAMEAIVSLPNTCESQDVAQVSS